MSIMMTVQEKLKNLPRIYVNSIEKNECRREVIRSHFYNFGVENYSFFITTPEQDRKKIIYGDRIENVNYKMHLVTAAYLEAIKHWYENTEEEYALFLEDDVFLETARYWNFTWDEFVNHLPSDWDCVHLGSIHMMHPSWNYLELDNKLKKNYYLDTNLISLIRRRYAKILIDRYIRGENQYDLTPPHILENPNADPNSETLIYMCTENSYKLLLFTENPYYGINSSFRTDYDLWFGSEKYPVSFISPNFTNGVIKWWRDIGSKKSISELMGEST